MITATEARKFMPDLEKIVNGHLVIIEALIETAARNNKTSFGYKIEDKRVRFEIVKKLKENEFTVKDLKTYSDSISITWEQ